MTKLLVSVRSVKEAKAALAGGADIIDVKEPRRGSLGRADDDVICEVVEAIGDSVPVSAALGELIDEPGPPPTQLRYIKVGLSGLTNDWQRRWMEWSQAVSILRVDGIYGNMPQPGAQATDGISPVACAPGCGDSLNSARERNNAVLVAYADVHDVEELLHFVNKVRPAAFLIDTKNKDGRTLFDFLPMHELRSLHDRCQVPLALAGSLNFANIDQLIPLNIDIIAVRGAVCRGSRQGDVDVDLVKRLASRLLNHCRSGRS